MSALQEQASLLRAFLRTDFRRLALGCGAGMLAAAIVGYFIGVTVPETVGEVLEAFQQMVLEAGVIDDTGNISVFALLRNNWQAMLTSAAYGAIPFLFLPMVSLMTNGALLGLLAGYYRSNGMSMAAYLAGILPHGVFELSALVLSIACGTCLCRNLCYLVLGSSRRVPLVDLLSNLLRVLLLIVLPLTVAAALIECYITPVVMGLFLPAGTTLAALPMIP